MCIRDRGVFGFSDFRGGYTTILEDWFGLDAKPIVNGSFEKHSFL